MKKPKRKHSTKLKKLLPYIRNSISNLMEHHSILLIATPYVGTVGNGGKYLRKEIYFGGACLGTLYSEEFKNILKENLNSLQKKYKKINLENLYFQIYIEDVNSKYIYNLIK